MSDFWEPLSFERILVENRQIFSSEISCYGRPQIGTFAYLEYLLGVSLFLTIIVSDQIAIFRRIQAKGLDPLETWRYVQSQNENSTFTKTVRRKSSPH